MRRRELSPEFWSDEKVWSLNDDAARLLLPGLFQLADREGRLLDRPFEIGAKIRPWAPREAVELVDKLVAGGLVLRYSVGDLNLLCLSPDLWARHQHVHPHEMASKLPPPGHEARSAPAPAAPAREKKPRKKKEQPDLPGVPPPEEKESADQWRLLDRARIEHCEKLGLSPGTQNHPGPALANKRMKDACEQLGLVDRIVDGEVLSRFDFLACVFDHFLLNDFGRVDKDGSLREPPWPLELFFSPNVLKRAHTDYQQALEQLGVG